MNDFKFIDRTERKYFAMIPYIITEIGLKGNEIAVYVAIKRSAGESSVCTKSKAKLAKQAGVCPKTIFTIIQKLCQVNKFLKKPLITCTERLTENGDNDTNLIEIVDIWDEAINLFQIISGEVNITQPHVKNTQPKVNVTGEVRYPLPGGKVKFTYKEEPTKKNLIKEEPPTTKPPLEKSGDGGGDLKKAYKFIKLCKEKDLPFEERLLKELYEKYPQASINSVEKFYARMKKNEKLPNNPGGWLRSEVIKEHEFLEQKKEYVY